MIDSATVKRALHELGAPGLAGAAALAVALAVAVLGRSWDSQAAQMQAESDALRISLRQQLAPTAVVMPATPQQWFSQLPPAAERQQRLADLLEMGVRAGLSGSRTEHRLAVDAASGLERLRISMPVTGDYVQLRRFIAAALQHDPALSLDSLKLRRPTPQSAELEADLAWSLHSRSEGTR